jgi:putative membrane protein
MFFIRFAINVLALLVVFLLVWNIQGGDNGNNVVLIAVVMAVVLSVINVFIRPIVLLLTLPANILTFGCLGIVINAVLFYFAARLVHIPVDFWRAALGWLVFSIISAALSQIALSE